MALRGGDDAPNLLARTRVELRPSADYHDDSITHHADSSPPSLIRIWVAARSRLGVVNHKRGNLKADAARLKVRIVLCPIPSPTQAQSHLLILRRCSYRTSSASLARSLRFRSCLGNLSASGGTAGQTRARFTAAGRADSRRLWTLRLRFAQNDGGNLRKCTRGLANGIIDAGHTPTGGLREPGLSQQDSQEPRD